MTAVEIGAKISLLDVFHARTRSQLGALIGRLAGALRELIG
ncbi:MAG: hypothetical protein ABSB76_38210 [Streptosporangiaceae bacterium]|jgi:hypothetical protein